MRLKLKFSESKIPFTYPTQNAVNSCIHRILGENNKYHNSFSNYCVSSLFGGVIVDNKMTYPNGAHFYVSSLDEELIEKIMFSVINGNVEMCDMKLIGIDIENFNLHNDYDIIRTISPILLKDNENIITYQDSDFIKVLTEKSKSKLLKNGFSENDVKTLKIEPFHFENARLKFPKVKNVVNKSSQVMLLVRGKKEMRLALYKMGLGKSTGCGFGAIEIMK